LLHFAAVAAQKEAALKAGEPWPPVSENSSKKRWINSTSKLPIATIGIGRRRSSAGSVAGVVASLASDVRRASTSSVVSTCTGPVVRDLGSVVHSSSEDRNICPDNTLKDISHARSNVAVIPLREVSASQPPQKLFSRTHHRSVSVGVLPRSKPASVSFLSNAMAQSTAAIGAVTGDLNIHSIARQRPGVESKNRKNTKQDEEVQEQMHIALSRMQSAYDSVLRYSSHLVLSEASVLAIIARVLKLRYRTQQSLLNEGQFVMSTAVCASFGLLDVAAAERQLVLRKRLITVQVIFYLCYFLLY